MPRPERTIRVTVIAAALSIACTLAAAQVRTVPDAKSQGERAAKSTTDVSKAPVERGEEIDRVVAIVNGDLVMESDVEEEERFTKLYPYRNNVEGKTLREQAINRLIDRALVLQQLAGFPVTPVTKEEVEKEETDLRADLPACTKADCKSDAAWLAFLTKLGFTRDELRGRLEQRAQVLRFIQQRFRNGLRISDKQIADYYGKEMLPEYAKAGTKAPPLDVLHDRIAEVILQEQVSSLLDQWLKTLRETGGVRMETKGEEWP